MPFSDEVRRRLQAQPAGSGDREPVRLPARRFVDHSFYEAERAEILGKAWLLAGRLDEVPRPGLYMTWEKTVVPLLIVHAVDNVVRCFYNSCRHRGAPVVRVARGRNRALRCQYHSWTYDTSGKLVSVPDERDFVDLRREERALVPVACEVANSAIFVNEEPEDDLGSWFGAAAEELASVGSEGLRTLDQRSVTIPVNWKRVMGRLLAAPPVPPRPGVDALATTAADVELLDGGHLRIVAPFDAVSARALGLSAPLEWANLSDEDLPSVPGLDPICAPRRPPTCSSPTCSSPSRPAAFSTSPPGRAMRRRHCLKRPGSPPTGARRTRPRSNPPGASASSGRRPSSTGWRPHSLAPRTR